MESYVEIVGKDGRRRRARKGDVLADGEVLVTPMTLMDAPLPTDQSTLSDGNARVVIDGYGSTTFVGHRPGFVQFGTPNVARALNDALDAARAPAEQAYAERTKRMTEAWKLRRKKRAPQPQGTFRSRGGVYPPPHGGDEGDAE